MDLTMIYDWNLDFFHGYNFKISLNYESMLTYLQRLGNYRTRLQIAPLYITFFKQIIKIFNWNFNIKLSKLIEWIFREVEEYRRPENTVNQFNIIKIYKLSHRSRIQILFKFPQIVNQETLEHIQGHKKRYKNFKV